MRRAVSLIALAVPAAVAGCSTSDFDRSCGGEPVRSCDPYEYARVTSATIEPEEIEVDSPFEEAHVRVEYESCDSADAPPYHRITLSARVDAEGLPDAGTSTRELVLADVRDDGESDGDETAGDGVVDVTIDNPFFDVPPEIEIVVELEPRWESCRGDAKEITYRTGAQYVPPRPDAGT